MPVTAAAARCRSGRSRRSPCHRGPGSASWSPLAPKTWPGRPTPRLSRPPSTGARPVADEMADIPGAEVVPLHAVEAQTEAALTEAKPPVYLDTTGRVPGERLPVIPPYLGAGRT